MDATFDLEVANARADKFERDNTQLRAQLREQLAAEKQRAEELQTALDRELVECRATIDLLDCTQREGGDTRHCSLDKPCMRCRAEFLLGDLLATIHRDGGHYQRDHGTEKAVHDARDLVVAARLAREETETELISTRKVLADTIREHAEFVEKLTAQIRAAVLEEAEQFTAGCTTAWEARLRLRGLVATTKAKLLKGSTP